MPKYTVAVTEVIQYLVPVEADNEEDAEEMGIDLIIEAADRDQYFVACTARDCDGVNLVEEDES